MSDVEEGPHTWVSVRLGRELTQPEVALVGLVCAAFQVGPWNLQPWTSLRDFGAGTGASWSTARDLATYDGDALTRLVILAHDRCMRVSVEPSGPRRIQIRAWPRDPAGTGRGTRHPTIERAIAVVRAQHPHPVPGWKPGDTVKLSLVGTGAFELPSAEESFDTWRTFCLSVGFFVPSREELAAMAAADAAVEGEK